MYRRGSREESPISFFSRKALAVVVLASMAGCSLPTDPPSNDAPASATGSPSPSPPPLASSPSSMGDPYRWTAQIRGGIDAVIATKRLVLVSSYGRPLLAFPASCGHRRASCDPAWRTARGVSGFTVSGGWVYATESFRSGRTWRAGVAAFPLDCAPDHRVCRETWFDKVGPISPNATKRRWWLGTPTRFTTPTVRDGVIYTSGSVDGGYTHPGEFFGPLYTFSASCDRRTGCPPLWRTASLNGIGTPTIRGGSVFVPSTSGLYTFREGCRSDGGTCQPLWHAPTNMAGNISNVLDQPVVSGASVVVTTEGDAGGGDSEPVSIFDYPAACRSDGGVCAPSWWARIRPWERNTSRPVVVGGGLIVGGRRGLIEYPTDCHADGPRCRDHRVLSDGRSEYTVYSAPALRGRSVVAATASRDHGRLTGFDVFGSPCERRVCRPSSSWHPQYRLQRIAAVGSHEVFAATESGVVAVSIPEGRHDEPRVVWRWSGPEGRVQQIVTDGCTVYAVTGHSLFAVRRC
jgi:hypothetical protein